MKDMTARTPPQALFKGTKPGKASLAAVSFFLTNPVNPAGLPLAALIGIMPDGGVIQPASEVMP